MFLEVLHLRKHNLFSSAIIWSIKNNILIPHIYFLQYWYCHYANLLFKSGSVNLSLWMESFYQISLEQQINCLWRTYKELTFYGDWTFKFDLAYSSWTELTSWNWISIEADLGIMLFASVSWYKWWQLYGLHANDITCFPCSADAHVWDEGITISYRSCEKKRTRIDCFFFPF